MKGFILSIVAGAIAFLLLLQVLPASMLDLKGDIVPQGLLVAAVVGVVNAVIKPIVKLLSFPVSLMTMGLSGFVINAVLLLGIAYFMDSLVHIKLTVGGWPAGPFTADTAVGAVVASVLLSIITAIVGLVVRD